MRTISIRKDNGIRRRRKPSWRGFAARVLMLSFAVQFLVPLAAADLSSRTNGPADALAAALLEICSPAGLVRLAAEGDPSSPDQEPAADPVDKACPLCRTLACAPALPAETIAFSPIASSVQEPHTDHRAGAESPRARQNLGRDPPALI